TDHGAAVELLGDEGGGWCGEEDGAGGPLLGRFGFEGAPGAQELACLLDRVGEQPGEDDPGRVDAELERGGDAEVAAATADTPEEVGVLVFACPARRAVGGDEADRANG